jgi:hypothetical protein
LRLGPTFHPPVAADDDELGNAIAEFLGGAIVFSVGNTHTIVINRS